MNPVNLQNIDPAVLMAVVQMIQNAQANANAMPQVIQLPDGSLYSGEMQNNVPHGKGTVKYRQPDEWQRLSYEGDWVNGNPHGSGTIQYSDGGSYLGEMQNDKINGKGYMRFAPNNGLYISYDGDWVDGKRNGFGTMLFCTANTKYVGHWVNDAEQGQGTKTWTEVVICESFDNGTYAKTRRVQRERTGTFENGHFWEGECKKNEKVINYFKKGEIQKNNCIIS